MKTNTYLMILVAALAACVASDVSAEAAPASASRWTLTIGPKMRSGMETKLSGGTSGSGAGAYDNGHVTDIGAGTSEDWSGNYEQVDAAGMPGGDDFYALRLNHTGASPSGRDDEEDRMGLAMSACYDFYSTERFALGLRGSFEGYWNMEQRFGGSASYLDTYLFSGGPFPGDPDVPMPGTTSSAVDSSPFLHEITAPGLSAKVSSDLYVFGLGPRATWHATSWLDAYAGVEGLLGISRTELSVGGASSSDTNAKLGVGGQVGLAAYIGYVGFFAEVGYQYLDPSETSCGGLTAETDFSGLTVAAGLAVRF